MSSNLGGASTSELEVVIDTEMNRKPCILMVPGSLRKLNEVAYTPQIIAIGPYHRGKQELTYMENHKTRYMGSFKQRITLDQLNDIRNFIKNNEERIRGDYSRPSNVSSEMFEEMILFDAVFIFELFLRYDHNDRSDFLLEEVWLRGIKRDLRLLENQLPYFLLEELYHLAFSNVETYPSFTTLSCTFFKLSFSHEGIKIKHFIDLCRLALIKHEPIANSKSKSEETTKRLHTAAKLERYGVKFKPVLGEKCLVDITLEQNERSLFPCSNVVELQIPLIKVYDHTESLARNVMIWELTNYSSETYFCSYIQLMSSLIKTKGDVDCLVRAGIIYNFVGSNAEIMNMFSNFCGELPEITCYYSEIICPLLDHCKYYDRWINPIPILKQEYFSDPWKSLATVAAVILLVLTLIQTLFTILQVVLPK